LATDPEEATRIFSEAVAQNYNVQDSERPVELDEEDAESSSSDEGLEDDVIPEIEDEQESSDEAEVCLFLPDLSHAHLSDVYRHPVRTPKRTTKAISRTSILSSRAKKRSVIQKSRPTSIVYLSY
jgi:hypothetical protein